jgi:hypothetical protein
MKRWYQNRESTYPKTLAKNGSDKRDLDFLVTWLAENNMTIEFEKYQGKNKEELLRYVRYYQEKYSEDESLMEDLKKAMKPLDWDLLTQLPTATSSIGIPLSPIHTGAETNDILATKPHEGD